MNSGEAAFGAYVSDIVIDDVLEGFDVRVCQLGEIGGDIVVELKRGRQWVEEGEPLLHIRQPSPQCIRSH